MGVVGIELYLLSYRDPYTGLLVSPHNWVALSFYPHCSVVCMAPFLHCCHSSHHVCRGSLLLLPTGEFLTAPHLKMWRKRWDKVVTIQVSKDECMVYGILVYNEISRKQYLHVFNFHLNYPQVLPATWILSLLSWETDSTMALKLLSRKIMIKSTQTY